MEIWLGFRGSIAPQPSEEMPFAHACDSWHQRRFRAHSHGAAIYDAKPQPKALYMAQGSAHARSLSVHRQEYTAKVRQFTVKYIK